MSGGMKFLLVLALILLILKDPQVITQVINALSSLLNG